MTFLKKQQPKQQPPTDIDLPKPDPPPVVFPPGPNGQRCDTCRWYVATHASCRRYPPAYPTGAWPLVSAGDWCGDWTAIHGALGRSA